MVKKIFVFSSSNLEDLILPYELVVSFQYFHNISSYYCRYQVLKLECGVTAENEALPVELATSPTADISTAALLTPKPASTITPVNSWLTQPLPLDLSETRQRRTSLSAPPTPPRSTKERTRHLSFSAISTLSGNQSDVDFNFSEFGPFSSSSVTPSETPYAAITPRLLLQLEAMGAGGGPCAAAASAILDLIAEILAETLLEQAKSTTIVEGILEAAPLYVTSDAALVFQGLILRRIINDLERRLMRDSEENHKKLDKNRYISGSSCMCSSTLQLCLLKMCVWDSPMAVGFFLMSTTSFSFIF